MHSDRNPFTSHRLGRLLRTAIACASVTAVGLGVVNSSHAATNVPMGTAGGLKYVRADGTAPQTVGTRTGDYMQAYCGNEWVSTGGGVAVNGDPRYSFVSASNVGNDGVFGGGWHALQPDRRVSVYAICSKSPSVSIQKRYANFAPAPSTVGFTTGCPTGHVLGGGVETPYPVAHVTTTMPVDGPDADKTPNDAWRGSGALLDDHTPELLLINIACSTGPQPAYRAAKVQVAAGEQHTLKVRCADRQHVSGGGIAVNGPADESHFAVSRPFDGPDADKVPDDGWLATVSNDGAAARTARGMAICLG